MPPRRVLAAVDFSEPSCTALAFAVRFAVQYDSELHVLHVQDPLLTAAAESRDIDLADDARHELESCAAAVGLHGRTAHLHVVTGTAAAAICDIATREQANVIVVGAHGMSGAEHVVFGSVAEGVIRRATTSVLVVPASWTPPDPARRDLLGTGPVIAATDFCSPSVEAAAAACTLATVLRTNVELVHVVPELRVLARWKPHADTAVAARVPAAYGQMTTMVKALQSPSPVRVRVEQGPLAERLAAAAAPSGDRHPLLVLGRRSETSRAGAPGSTAYRVLMLARVPVLVHLPEED